MARTKYLKIRLTEAEYASIKKSGEHFGSASAFLRTAISQFDDRQARQRFELMDALYTLHREHDARLAWCGSNLNQVVHKLHLLDMEGLVPHEFIEEEVLPAVSAVRDEVMSFRESLGDAVSKSLKI